MAYLFDHIRTSYLGMTLASQDRMRWLGQHVNIALGQSWDRTLALAENPDLATFLYVAGGGFYKGFDFAGSISFYWPSMVIFADQMGYDIEDYFLHYDVDKIWTTGPRSTAIMVEGYPPGVSPGYPHGTAKEKCQSRVISQMFGAPAILTRNIATIERASNIVTVKTKTVHRYTKKDTIRIGGVDDSFNGVFIISTTPTEYSFTYEQAGPDATLSGMGTSTYRGWNNLLHSWKIIPSAAYFRHRIANAIGTVGKCGDDPGGNPFNGYFYDSPEGYSGIGDGITEYIEDGSPADKYAWISKKWADWANYHKEGWAEYLSGTGKPPMIFYNAGGLNPVGTPSKESFYGYCPDVITNEMNLGPGTQYTQQPALQQIARLMIAFNRKILWQVSSRANRVTNPIWTLDTGAIYYTDAFSNNTTPIHYIVTVPATATGAGYAPVKKNTKDAMVQNSFFFDLNGTAGPAGRFYVWGKYAEDPTTWQYITTAGRDQEKLASLSIYYIWGRLGDCGHFSYHDQGTIYSLQPNDPMNWFLAIEYNVGQPQSGGLKRDNSGDWIPATDFWGESAATSSLGFEMWRGNGVETDNNGVSLNSQHRLWARRLGKGYAIFRPGSTWSAFTGSNPKTFVMPFRFRLLRANGTLGEETDSLTLGQYEGGVLIDSTGGQDVTAPKAPIGLRIIKE